MDTIFAESSPPGKGGVSIIRLSGPDARKFSEDLVGPMAQPRYAYLRNLIIEDEVIDRVLAIRFDQGSSFTGEQVVELHLHGAPIVVKRVEIGLLQRGARRAQAGEFTRRAFMSGQIDLNEAEGLGDLLAAETEEQRKLAMSVANGELSRRVESWRQDLIQAGALIEASIDFSDEEIPDDVWHPAYDLLENVRKSLQEQISGYPAAERVRTGFTVAIIGPPNSGKSSLLNRIAKRDIAIVTDIPGTTRDIVELQLDLNGLAVTFLDTAGLRETDDAVEKIGVQKALARSKDADLTIFLSDDMDHKLEVHADIYLSSKADLSGDKHAISAKTGAGIEGLLEDIYERLHEKVAGAGIVSHQRQVEILQRALTALETESEPEILAEAVRSCCFELEVMIGRVGTEDYLDLIFSSFCVGK